jgi:Fe2+ transport system protein FeoA
MKYSMIIERFAFNSIIAKLREKQEEHHAHELDCTALCCAQNGQCAVVAHLVGDESESERLRDLGVREGAIVTVLRDGDPLVIKIDEARFGIGRSAAMNVLCQIVE